MQPQVNLLPKEHRPKPAVRVWPIIIAMALTVNLLGMGSWWLFLQLDLSAAQSDLQLATDTVKKLELQVQQAESAALLEAEVLAKREFVTTAIADSQYWYPMLEAVERAMVPGVIIKNLNASAAGAVSLNGETDTVKSVADFLGSLQVETVLSVVRVSSVQPAGTFQITLEDWSGREVEPDE